MKELKSQLVGALLVILTLAAVICSGLNYQQQKLVRFADDGAVWMDVTDTSAGADHPVTKVVVIHLEPDGPAEQAGIRKGDVLLRIGATTNGSGAAVETAADVPKILFPLGAWKKVEYTLKRNGVELNATVFTADANANRGIQWHYLVGLAWLSIGLFVWFRRRRAPKSTHFYLLCLTSFILHSFHYTGKLNAFDTVIYFGNVVAGLLAPALFLHFCLTFPEPRKPWGPWQVVSVYLPALSLMALQVGAAAGVIRTAVPMTELRWMLDRAWLLIFCGSYLTGAVLLELSYRRADDPIIRQQLKWLRNGALAGIVPFAALYAGPFVLGMVPAAPMQMAVLFLAIVPLAWAYAILRYRLMDVDIIFQQGFVYLMATLAVLGIVYALVFSLAPKEGISSNAVILLVLVAAIVFEPLRTWIQQQLDRYVFYKDRYDYRVTLINFARELTSDMDLDRTLASVGERLVSTLQVSHAAFFLCEDDGSVRLHSVIDHEGRKRTIDERSLDMSFLATEPGQAYLFFERTKHAIDVVTRELPQSVRATIATLDLTYYLPCVFRGRTLAWLGISRTAKGDFLSTDDMDLLATLSGYVAMAAENSQLYQTLADKAQQYERLKEFSENIVESINVGILAADLEDRVESWNSQIERLTGIPRSMALGRRLSELFPAELSVHFDHLRGENKVHQLYKMQLRPKQWAASVGASAESVTWPSNEAVSAQSSPLGGELQEEDLQTVNGAAHAAANGLGLNGGSSVPHGLTGNGTNGHGELNGMGEIDGVAAANGYAQGVGKGRSTNGALTVPGKRKPEGSTDVVVNLAIAPLVTKEGQNIGRLVIFHDITEREDLERRLVQADKLSSIGLLAAGVAHEVNTPLAVISTYAQMLAKQVHGDEAKTKLLDKIARQTFRASEIVNSLLNFSRTSSTEFEEMDINRVIRETVSLLEHQLQKARVHVELKLDEELPQMKGNFGKLQQVFLNLFLNARDAMTDQGGGALTIATSATGSTVRVEVRDSGPGIDQDHLARIFDPFFTTKGAKKGTGLGLSVSYGIVEEHGGMIEADSRPGEGARFRLEFPAVRKTVNA